MIIYCENPGFGHILSSFSLNRPAICLKRPQNLPQTSILSLQSPKSDSLLVRMSSLTERSGWSFQAWVSEKRLWTIPYNNSIHWEGDDYYITSSILEPMLSKKSTRVYNI